ncbi:unnamed protein product [Blepharisma stoltei]|uniref:Uncharacterized protein n=1 Tax=Blepharisma stoltei TaxID=1481888 RepID=A0AAU9IEC7_9CILI|nr:unnamed protein product [Blepharisma stoltei]
MIVHRISKIGKSLEVEKYGGLSKEVALALKKMCESTNSKSARAKRSYALTIVGQLESLLKSPKISDGLKTYIRRLQKLFQELLHLNFFNLN